MTEDEITQPETMGNEVSEESRPSEAPRAMVESSEPRGKILGILNTQKFWIIAGSAMAIIVISLGIFLYSGVSSNGAKTVKLSSNDYMTNVELSEANGAEYAHIFVNHDVAEIVLEAPLQADTDILRNFFDNVDTSYPGEHNIELSDRTFHVIIDGIAGEGDATTTP